MSGLPRLRASIGVQLVALIIACLLATHLITFLTLVLMPPPRPPLYRPAEVAGALHGGPLTARFGRPMVRTVTDELPPELMRRRRLTPQREALALQVGAPIEDVLLAPRPRSWIERMVLGGGGSPPRTLVIEHRRHARPGEPPPPPRPERLRHRALSEAPIFGDFSAALRRPDGGWTLVRSTPEPFPNAWQQRLLIMLGVGFAVVAPAGFLFARRITAPLRRFSEAAERLGRDPQAPPVTLSGPGEIGAAAEAFNAMQARLKRYIDDRTAMVGAISHDLRTPLARMRFKLEGAPGGVKDSVLADVAQMEQMIQGALAFIRDGSTPGERQRLDLLSLVECVVDDAALVGGDVELLASEPVTVEGDPVALQRLFENLVDNAMKYGTRARLRVRREAELAVVDIDDAGPGLPPAEREQVFQPFYRADAARNLDAGGMGLGLPIARSTARAHGGDVELLAGSEGLRARVTLPLA